MNKKWYYKGLLCELKPDSSYRVSELGAITRLQHILLANNNRAWNKKLVEEQVDRFLSDNSIKPVSVCQHYLDSAKIGSCNYSIVCNEDCPYCYCDNQTAAELRETIKDLKEDLKDLERELEDVQSNC